MMSAPIRTDEGHVPGVGNGGLSMLSLNPLVAELCGGVVWGLLGQLETLWGGRSLGVNDCLIEPLGFYHV